MYLLARGQRELGHEPLVIAAPEAPLIRRLRSAGIAVAAVRMVQLKADLPVGSLNLYLTSARPPTLTIPSPFSIP